MSIFIENGRFCCQFSILVEVSDDDEQNHEIDMRQNEIEEEQPITPDDLFRDIQEVKSKLAEVRQLLEGRQSSGGMTGSQSDMHLKVCTPEGTPSRIHENTGKYELAREI